MSTAFDLNQITGGNAEANRTIEAWGAYLRCCDDIVDEGQWTRERLLTAFKLGVRFYTTPFYLAHRGMLQAPVLCATSLWAVANEWEKGPELWKRQWADVMRHADGLVIATIAFLCKGWEFSQAAIRAGLISAYQEHREKHGDVA